MADKKITSKENWSSASTVWRIKEINILAIRKENSNLVSEMKADQFGSGRFDLLHNQRKIEMTNQIKYSVSKNLKLIGLLLGLLSKVLGEDNQIKLLVVVRVYLVYIFVKNEMKRKYPSRSDMACRVQMLQFWLNLSFFPFSHHW